MVHAWRFPGEEPSATVVSGMDAPGAWTLSKEKTNSLEAAARTKGEMQLSCVEDEEKGSCLELVYQGNGKLPKMFSEYAMLRPRAPIEVTKENLRDWDLGSKGIPPGGQAHLGIHGREGRQMDFLRAGRLGLRHAGLAREKHPSTMTAGTICTC